MAVGFIGLRLLRRFHVRALISGDLVSWVTERPARNHLAGAFLFGVGWAVTDSLPSADRGAARPRGACGGASRQSRGVSSASSSISAGRSGESG